MALGRMLLILAVLPACTVVPDATPPETHRKRAAPSNDAAADTPDSARAARLGRAIAADRADPAQRDVLMLYGRFVGEWDVEVTNFPLDKPPVHATGEWIFGWALEGRAIQDVWIVPARGQRDAPAANSSAYGTTIRFYDTRSKVWQIVWINPARGDVSRMTAREVDGEIVQQGTDDDGLPFRWVFHDIEHDRFRWRAEDSADGKTWTLRQRMVVTRRRL